MNAPLLTLLALMAIFPLNGFAQTAGCTLNGKAVPGDPEVIEGTDSADTIDCSTSLTRHDIYGYAGDDHLIGSSLNDFIAGGSGDDEIHGGAGDDAIDGGGSNDLIHGDDGNDVIFGGVGSAPASGVGCTLQTAFIAAGSSYLTKGGSGDDEIYGGHGNDCIDAGSGEDFVYGEEGNDTLEGGNHGDVLDGGPGDDYIDGGWHSDTCIGGVGSDVFISCEFENDTPAYCGDETCDTGEDSCSCSQDCGNPPDSEHLWCTDGFDNDCDTDTDCADSDCSDLPDCSSPPPPPGAECGNNVCDPGEDCSSCSQDCSSQTNGRPRNRYCCGDGITGFKEERDSLCDGNY